MAAKLAIFSWVSSLMVFDISEGSGLFSGDFPVMWLTSFHLKHTYHYYLTGISQFIIK